MRKNRGNMRKIGEEVGKIERKGEHRWIKWRSREK